MNQEYLKLFKNQEEYDAAATKPVVSHLIEEVEVIINDNRPKSIITYTASSKLPEVSGSTFGRGLHLDGFDVDVESHTFENGIGTITFVDTVRTIKFNAFYQAQIYTVNMPDTITTIGEDAFDACTSMTSVTVPDSVVEIQGGAFGRERRLRRMNSDVNGVCNIPNGITAIPMSFINSASTITTVNIHDRITSIGSLAFQECSGLTTVNFGNSVESIGTMAFNRCYKLRTMVLPDSVKSLNTVVFGTCSGLTSIEIGSGIESINNYCFSACTNLSSITIKATTPPTIGLEIFRGMTNFTIYVPSESVNTYKTASGWSSYASKIQAIP